MQDKVVRLGHGKKIVVVWVVSRRPPRENRRDDGGVVIEQSFILRSGQLGHQLRYINGQRRHGRH